MFRLSRRTLRPSIALAMSVFLAAEEAAFADASFQSSPRTAFASCGALPTQALSVGALWEGTSRTLPAYRVRLTVAAGRMVAHPAFRWGVGIAAVVSGVLATTKRAGSILSLAWISLATLGLQGTESLPAPPWHAFLTQADFAQRAFANTAYPLKGKGWPVASSRNPPSPTLQSVDQEIRYLLKYLQSSHSSVAAPLLDRYSHLAETDSAQRTQLLRDLRRTVWGLELQNPTLQDSWNAALGKINGYLERLKKNYPADDEFVYKRTLQMLQELMVNIPLLDEKVVAKDVPGELVNLRAFILDIPHGLAHSLDVLEDVLKVGDEVFKNPDEKKHAQEVWIGIALYHDLTGLRDRNKHHETSRDLAVSVLSAAKDENGAPRYTPELIDAIARGCQNHRGQTFPRPESRIEQIFMEIDEFNLLKDTSRILNQGGKGFFNPDVLDVSRDVMLGELNRFAGGRHNPFRHESPGSDRAMYWLMTYIMRTNPDNYTEPVIKQRVMNMSDRFKNEVRRIAKTKIREEVLSQPGATLTDVKRQLYRFEGVMRELEALYRHDRQARDRLRLDIGDNQLLTQRMARLTKQWDGETHWSVEEGPLASAAMTLLGIQAARAMPKNRLPKRKKPSNGVHSYPGSSLATLAAEQEVFPNLGFRIGTAIADLYIEDASISPEDLFHLVLSKGLPLPTGVTAKDIKPEAFTAALRELVTGSPSGRAYGALDPHMLYTGFAWGYARITSYRVKRLRQMISVNPDKEPAFNQKDEEFGFSAAQKFLYDIGAGASITESLRSLRHDLDSLRYGPVRPETWDAPFESISALDRAIRSLRKSNTHIHTSGGLFVEDMAALVLRHHRLRGIFAEKFAATHPELDPTNPTDLRQFLYGQDIDSVDSFENAFKIGHTILDSDLHGEIYRDWFEQIGLNAGSQGVELVGVVSAFGQSPLTKGVDVESLETRVTAAIEGLMAAEKQTKTRGTLILGVRKDLSPENAMDLVKRCTALRDHLKDTRGPEFATRMVGIDSVSSEEGFDWAAYAPAFRYAKDHGFWIKTHVGEFWNSGGLRGALLNLERVIDEGIVNQVTNTISLFVDPRGSSLYTDQEKQDILAIQDRITQKMIERQIWVDISPSSNHRISRFSRKAEGWSFHPLGSYIERGLLVLVTDDDPGLFETDLSLEFLSLYLGWTAYGRLGQVGSYRLLRKLLDNSEKFLDERLAAWKIPRPAGRSHPALTLACG